MPKAHSLCLSPSSPDENPGRKYYLHTYQAKSGLLQNRRKNFSDSKKKTEVNFCLMSSSKDTHHGIQATWGQTAVDGCVTAHACV